MSLLMFQSTRPQGARPVVAQELRTDNLGFNPRARRGRDIFINCLGINKTKVSIHAPAGGATLKCYRYVAKHSPFQSTRPQGARRVMI